MFFWLVDFSSLSIGTGRGTLKYQYYACWSRDIVSTSADSNRYVLLDILVHNVEVYSTVNIPLTAVTSVLL
jgi:hypothetical protein